MTSRPWDVRESVKAQMLVLLGFFPDTDMKRQRQWLTL
jgi:hypothetical protein